MERSEAFGQLPEMYAAALDLRRAGLSDDAIARELELEPEAVAPLFRIAEEKLAALEPAAESARSEMRNS
jgi:hypothetical protein